MAKAQNGAEDCVSRQEFQDLEAEVQKLAKAVGNYIQHSDRYLERLIDVLGGSPPKGSVPIETHQMVVRGLILSFSVVIVVAIGAVKVLPLLVKGGI